jgi:hypothetical protein
MIGKEEFKRLYGWDDGSIYFMDDHNKEWCVTEEKDLYDRLTQLCTDYFKNKSPQDD